MIFDRVWMEGVNRARQVNDYASGKSVNVARVLHTLGHDVLATGFAGGARGGMLLQDLDRSGIRHAFVDVAPETRQCITVIDRSAGTATELVEESSTIEAAGWEALDRTLRGVLPKAGVWIFSGTLPPGAPQDFYARWFPMGREQGARIILDARGEPLRLALRHGNGIFKLNREELAETLGEDLGDEQRLLAAVKSQTPPGGAMIVTLGAGGALGSDGQSCWRVRSPKVKAVSAVGSGDAFAAGLGAALSQGRSLSQAMSLAAACGAANALTPLAGRLNAADVDRLNREATVERIVTIE